MCVCVCVAHIDSYSAYGGYDDYDDGYGDGGYMGGGYGAYGSRGGRGAGRGSGMRGMGNGRSAGRGRGGRGGRSGGMMKSTYQSTTGHSVHMRGLPFSATESDIVEVTYKAAVILVVIRSVWHSARYRVPVPTDSEKIDILFWVILEPDRAEVLQKIVAEMTQGQ